MSKTRLRILGIDPGSRVTGFGVIDSDGRDSRHIASGCIRLGKDGLPARLGRVYAEIVDVVAEYKPELLAVEQVFMARNAAAALTLGQARGAAIAACVQAGLTVHEYAPRAIKLAVVGNGGADKKQVQHMVRILLGLNQNPAADAADALAVALCHSHTNSTHLLIRSRR